MRSTKAKKPLVENEEFHDREDATCKYRYQTTKMTKIRKVTNLKNPQNFLKQIYSKIQTIRNLST